MNIKSLLLGSAAALIAVSGARAADAVVAPEPEPVEYVRVCDVYGTSFYYIPGTEICLKIGGYFRYDIGAGDLFGDDVDGDGNGDTWHKRARYQLRVDARSETELGTLRGYAEVNFDWSTGFFAQQNFIDLNGDGVIDQGDRIENSNGYDARFNSNFGHAYVELAGLRIGVTDSLFVTETGYASGVVNDGLISYGPFTTHQIAYTFDFGNGFSASAAVEEGTGAGIITDYTPNVVVGAAWSGGMFGLSGVAAYAQADDEWAGKIRLDLNFDTFSLFVMGAGTDDADDSGGNYYATWGGDWAAWVGGAIKFDDRFTFNAEFGINDLDDYSIDADVNIVVVPNFVVTPGVGWKHTDNGNVFEANDEDQFGGYLRTQFSF
jgi:hypothetical protein